VLLALLLLLKSNNIIDIVLPITVTIRSLTNTPLMEAKFAARGSKRMRLGVKLGVERIIHTLME